MHFLLIVARLSLSLPCLLWCGLILICPLGRSCSASFQVILRGNYSSCSYRSGVSVGGGEFRIFLHCQFEPPPLKTFISSLLSTSIKSREKTWTNKDFESMFNTVLKFALIKFNKNVLNISNDTLWELYRYKRQSLPSKGLNFICR